MANKVLKAKCIINVNVEHLLEVGKVYEIVESPLNHQFYFLKDDIDFTMAFDYYHFEMLED